MSTYCLSFHAAYRCRHSGVCCADVWPIPVEPRVVRLIDRREIELPNVEGPLFVPPPHPGLTGAALVTAHHEGWCVFFERDRGRLCTIHRQRGADALPSSCRHFPRVFLCDGRGTRLSLSHFCPTAAGMLLEDTDIRVVQAQAPLALDGAVEGLDATDTLPPLLRPEMLTDLAGYDAWEVAAIRTLARADLTHDQALSAIAAATEQAREWRPDMGPMDAFVARAFGSTPCQADRSTDRAGDAKRLDLVDAACPHGTRAVERAGPDDRSGEVWSRLVEPAWRSFDAPVKRYLAARLFATWMAYRGSGLRTIVEWIRICLAVLRHETARQCAAAGRTLDAEIFVETVRECDRVLVHVVDSRRLAIELLGVETAGVA